MLCLSPDGACPAQPEFVKMEIRNFPRIDPDELLQRLIRGAESPNHSAFTDAHFGLKYIELEELKFVPPFRSDLIRPVPFRDLKKYDGTAFIDAAYTACLRHLPDPQGKREYLDRLKSGATHAEIVARLKYSREGRTIRAKIQGLYTALILDFLQRIPIIGKIIISFLNLLTMHESLREIRDRQEKMRNHINGFQRIIEGKYNRLVEEANRSGRENRL